MSDRSLRSSADIAASLRMLARTFDDLGDAPTPDLYLSLSIQPQHATGDAHIAVIDRIGIAVSGQPGETREMSSGVYHHTARGTVAGIHVSVFTSVTSPKERELRAEIARLRALAAGSDVREAVA